MRAIILATWIALVAFTTASDLTGKTFTPKKIFQDLHREPPPPPKSLHNTKSVETDYFFVEVDHFKEGPKPPQEHYYMRYMYNDEHYKPGGPLFIYIGAEWEITPGWIQGGHTFDMARHHNGFLVYTEHRYYGTSRPTVDATFENLQWLNVDQALHDLSEFIKHIKQKILGLKDSKVIVVGGSYAGTMATWMRQKYPDVVDGAWASSAPLVAKVDFVEYKEVMGNAFRTIGGQDCYERFEEAFAEMERLIDIRQPERIEKDFQTCTKINLDNQLDVWNLFSTFGNTLGGVVQYHWPGAIEGVCDVMTDSRYPDGMAALAAYIRNQWGPYCYGFEYKDSIAYYQQTQWGASSEIWRQWYYQTCNEFGYYQSSGSPDQPFGSSFPVELYTQMCTDAYDSSLTHEQVEKNIQRTNRKYHGLDPNVTKVFFTQGDVDPWHPIGINTDYNQLAPAYVIPGHSHCADLYSMSESDTTEMKFAKQKIWDLVDQWIKE